MKKLHFILLSTAILLLSSCGECEDKTLQVNESLLSWLPYSEEATLTFVSDTDSQVVYTLIPDVTERQELDGDCTTTTIQPFIVLNTENQDAVLRIWFNQADDFLSGRIDQLWGILDNEDGLIRASGAVVDLNTPELLSETVVLNDIEFSDVLTLPLVKNGETIIIVYLQRDSGLVAYELEGELWMAQ